MTYSSDTARAGAEGRSRVHNLARTNLDRAAEEARKIQHGWYRCQSLAHVAAKLKSDEMDGEYGDTAREPSGTSAQVVILSRRSATKDLEMRNARNFEILRRLRGSG